MSWSPRRRENIGVARMVLSLAKDDGRRASLCQVNKTERKKEAGLLQPLPIPERPWQCLSMAFISGFPKVEAFGSVWVVVDKFSKYVVFVPAPGECPAEEAARIFFSNVVKHFGMPKDIVSD